MDEQRALEQSITEWALSEQEFLVKLVSQNDIDKSSYMRGLSLIKKYVQGVECLCGEFLGVICELFLQLGIHAKRLADEGKKNEADFLIDALIEIEQIVNLS